MYESTSYLKISFEFKASFEVITALTGISTMLQKEINEKVIIKVYLSTMFTHFIFLFCT